MKALAPSNMEVLVFIFMGMAGLCISIAFGFSLWQGAVKHLPGLRWRCPLDYSLCLQRYVSWSSPDRDRHC